MRLQVRGDGRPQQGLTKGSLLVEGQAAQLSAPAGSGVCPASGSSARRVVRRTAS